MKAAMNMTLATGIKLVKRLLFWRTVMAITKAVCIIVLVIVAYLLVRKYSKRMRMSVSVKLANFFGRHMLK